MENFNNENKEKQERQLDNLIDLVENHTRTKRHLEQYSEIGSHENKENAREKQQVREEEIENLKRQLMDKTEGEVKKEEVQNLVEKYQSTQAYLENNYEQISEEDRKNLQEKQENRRTQIENLSKNIYYNFEK